MPTNIIMIDTKINIIFFPPSSILFWFPFIFFSICAMLILLNTHFPRQSENNQEVLLDEFNGFIRSFILAIALYLIV